MLDSTFRPHDIKMDLNATYLSHDIKLDLNATYLSHDIMMDSNATYLSHDILMDSSSHHHQHQDNLSCTTHTKAEEEIIILWRCWLEGYLQLFLSVLGLVSNSLSIFILTRSSLAYKTFNQLLTAMALFDSIFLLIMFSESVGRSFQFNSKDYYYVKGFLTPYFLYPVKAISMTGSVFMMVSIAVERYIAVCTPFNRIPESVHQGRSTYGGRKMSFRFLIYLLPVILFSIILNITKFMESYFIPEDPFIRISSLRINYTYLSVMPCIRLVLLGIIPLLVVSTLNYKIYSSVRKSSSSRKRDDTLSMLLTFIVIIFILCSAPRLVILMYEVTVISTIKHCLKVERLFPFWNHILGFVSHNLLALNPFLNFLVYCVVGKTFRRVADKNLRELFCCAPTSYSSSFDGRRGSRNTWSYLGPQSIRRHSLFEVRRTSFLSEPPNQECRRFSLFSRPVAQSFRRFSLSNSPPVSKNIRKISFPLGHPVTKEYSIQRVIVEPFEISKVLSGIIEVTEPDEEEKASGAVVKINVDGPCDVEVELENQKIDSDSLVQNVSGNNNIILVAHCNSESNKNKQLTNQLLFANSKVHNFSFVTKNIMGKETLI